MQSFIPLYFNYNMDFVRLVSYYVQVLKYIDKSYSGFIEIFTSAGFSVQSQGRYPLRTTINT